MGLIPGKLPLWAYGAALAGGFVVARVGSGGQPSSGSTSDTSAPAADDASAITGSSADGVWGGFTDQGGVFGDPTAQGVPPSPYSPPPAAPPPIPLPSPAPSPVPPVSSPPAPTGNSLTLARTYGSRPAGAVGVVDLRGVRLYSVTSGVAREVATGSVHAWVGTAVHYAPNATLRRILSGGNQGRYCRLDDDHFTAAT